MSEKDKKPVSDKFPTAVAITSVICATIVLITIAGMIFSWIMVDHIADKWPDGNITINHNK
jgi:hypothetical protein